MFYGVGLSHGMLSLLNFIDYDEGHGRRVPEPAHAVDHVVLENLFPFCFRAACFVFVHGVLKFLPMVFYGVGFEPRYWNLSEYLVDCAGSGGRPSDGCDKFLNGRGQSVLVR